MKYGYKTILCVGLLVILIIIHHKYFNKVDGYQNYNMTAWSPDLIKRFNVYQTTMNNNTNQFNLELLQQQATPEEAEELLKTGHWPWPNELKQQYLDNVKKSPIIKIEPQYALDYAMGIYNKKAARELLAWNTKEGQFLLYGGLIGKTDGMSEDLKNTIKCNANGEMEKKVYNNNGHTSTVVKPENIPKEMPGFSFVKGACNPCKVFNDNRDFSCPFRLNVEGDDSISEIWQQLWNL